jgi:hypothetical protein
MAFKVKRAGKDDGASPSDEKGKRVYEQDVDEADHGDEGEDVQKKGQKAAGQDLIDAIKGGDPHEVYAAHRHLTMVHASHTDKGMGDPDGGDGPMGASELVASIKGEKKHKKED